MFRKCGSLFIEQQPPSVATKMCNCQRPAVEISTVEEDSDARGSVMEYCQHSRLLVSILVRKVRTQEKEIKRRHDSVWLTLQLVKEGAQNWRS